MIAAIQRGGKKDKYGAPTSTVASFPDSILFRDRGKKHLVYSHIIALIPNWVFLSASPSWLGSPTSLHNDFNNTITPSSIHTPTRLYHFWCIIIWWHRRQWPTLCPIHIYPHPVSPLRIPTWILLIRIIQTLDINNNDKSPGKHLDTSITGFPACPGIVQQTDKLHHHDGTTSTIVTNHLNL